MSVHLIDIRKLEPVYYHREYAHDVGEQSSKNSRLDQSKRVAGVALTFLSLYKPFSFPISLGMGAVRSWTCIVQLCSSIEQGNPRAASYQLLQTAIAIIALAGTIFAHPLGMLITTGHDVIFELSSLVCHLEVGEYRQAAESCLSIVNNLLYLALMVNGGWELVIISLAAQILLGIYHSQAEFRKGNYLEGTGHLLITMVRGGQLVGPVQRWEARREAQGSAAKKGS